MRKRIITALLAAAMMMTALSGCFEYVEENPESSSETNVTTSAQSKSSSSKTATTSAAQTTTSQAATTSKKPTTTAKKDPTTAKFKYSLTKRLTIVVIPHLTRLPRIISMIIIANIPMWPI